MSVFGHALDLKAQTYVVAELVVELPFEDVVMM